MLNPILTTAILITISTLVFNSCKKDCDCNSQNRLEFEENTIALNKAIIENWSQHIQDEAYEGYRLIVGVYSPEVTIHYSNSDLDSLSGQGHGILFELFSEEANNFASTDYIFSTDHETGTFSFGIVYHNFLFEHDDWLEESFINRGHLSISTINGELTLEFTGYFETGELVTASYTGEYIYRMLI